MTALSQNLVYHRLWLPRPLDPSRVLLFLQRLAADPLSPWLVLETRATAKGIAHLVAVHPPQIPWLYQTLHHLLPGIAISSDEAAVGRTACEAAADIVFVPGAVALRTDDPIAVTTAMLSALAAHLNESETLAVQFVLGPRHSGRHVRQDTIDPHQSMWSRLSSGNRQITGTTRVQVEDRVSRHGFGITIRIGASIDNATVRRQRLSALAGALGVARGAGVRLRATRCKPARFDAAAIVRRWPQRLAPQELLGLLAWPIGERDLPGVPPIHPRQLLPTVTPQEVFRRFGRTTLAGTDIPVGISRKDGLVHTVLLGPTGSGKSTVLLNLIRADVAFGSPLLVVDPKKQLIDDIIATCIPEYRSGAVVVIDPASATPVGYNPLDVGDRDPDVVVDSLLAVFKYVFADGWGPRTEDIFLSSLLTLARAGRRRPEPYTLVDLPRLLTDIGFRQKALTEAHPDEVLAGFWASYSDMTVAAQAAMIAAPMNKLRRYLLRPAARNILGQASPRFRLRDIFRQNKIVLVPLNDALIGPVTAELLGSLIVAEAWQAAQERGGESHPTDRPATVVVDECQKFIHLPTSFGDVLSQSRSYGVGWILAHQQRSQLPKDLAEAVDSNARNKLIFRLESSSDAAAIAKLAPGLEVEDFQKLPRHHAYARVVVGGESSGWCTVMTDPPPPSTDMAEIIRTRSRDQYGGEPPASTPIAQSNSTTRSQLDDIPVGRKKRSRHDFQGSEGERGSK